MIKVYDYAVARLVRQGKGGIVAVGDSQFLLNKNLEGQNEFVVLDNVRFFSELLQYTVGVKNP